MVLLAEDHPTNQKVIQLILDTAGVELEIVENGALALERLAREPFDLVLMDMQMPELDGCRPPAWCAPASARPGSAARRSSC